MLKLTKNVFCLLNKSSKIDRKNFKNLKRVKIDSVETLKKKWKNFVSPSIASRGFVVFELPTDNQ